MSTPHPPPVLAQESYRRNTQETVRQEPRTVIGSPFGCTEAVYAHGRVVCVGEASDVR